MIFLHGPLDLFPMFEKWNKDTELYFVGGFVRDMLLHKTPNDFDLCTNLTPDEMKELFQHNNMSFYENNNSTKFGTLIIQGVNDDYEITTYRKENGYADNRHPDNIEFTKDIMEDLKRRDFTINAIAYHPTKGYVEVEGAREDLKNGIIRAVGNPDQRFEEDALRILRALRFAIKYGFTIEKETAEAIHRNVYLLSNISKERVTEEFRKILTCGQPIHDIFLEYKDVIGSLITDFRPSFNFQQNNPYHEHDVYEHCLCVTDAIESDDFITKLAGLFHDIGKPACYEQINGKGTFHGHPEKSKEITENICQYDLTLTKKEKEKLLILVQYHDYNFENSLRFVKKNLNKFGEENLQALMKIHHADVKDHIFPDNIIPTWGEIFEIDTYLQQIKDEDAAFKLNDLAINGKDLINTYQLSSGPMIGEILNHLLEKVINDEVPNTKPNLLNEVQQYLQIEKDFEMDFER